MRKKNRQTGIASTETMVICQNFSFFVCCGLALCFSLSFSHRGWRCVDHVLIHTPHTIRIHLYLSKLNSNLPHLLLLFAFVVLLLLSTMSWSIREHYVMSYVVKSFRSRIWIWEYERRKKYWHAKWIKYSSNEISIEKRSHYRLPSMLKSRSDQIL